MINGDDAWYVWNQVCGNEKEVRTHIPDRGVLLSKGNSYEFSVNGFKVTLFADKKGLFCSVSGDNYGLTIDDRVGEETIFNSRNLDGMHEDIYCECLEEYLNLSRSRH